MSIASKIEDVSTAAQSKGRQAVTSAAATVEEGAEAATEFTKHQVEKLESLIRSNPLAAAGIAAGVGFLIALMARRS